MGATEIGEEIIWLAKDVGVVMSTWQAQYSWGETEGRTIELVNASVGGVDYPSSSAKSMGDVKIPPLSVSPRFGPQWR